MFKSEAWKMNSLASAVICWNEKKVIRFQGCWCLPFRILEHQFNLNTTTEILSLRSTSLNWKSLHKYRKVLKSKNLISSCVVNERHGSNVFRAQGHFWNIIVRNRVYLQQRDWSGILLKGKTKHNLLLLNYRWKQDKASSGTQSGPLSLRYVRSFSLERH